MKKINNEKPRMSIAVDALGIDKPGGARTATLYLFEEVVRLRPHWRFIFYLSKYETSLERNNVTQVILPLKRGILARLLFQLFLIIDLFFRKVDIVHFAKSQASFVPGKKVIFTIFDLTTLLYPDQFSKMSVWYWRHIQGRMARAACKVVAISNDVAKDIVSFYKVENNKIKTIYLDSQFKGQETFDPIKAKQICEELKLPPCYMLFIGLLAKKKNLETIIHAMAIIKEQQNFQIPLLIVGPRYTASDASDLLGLIDSLKLDSSIRYLGELDGERLRVVLQGSFCLLLPSVHEGFGITAMEGIKMGIPVIASNVAALPEIIGKGGLLVDDYLNPGRWAEIIQRLYIDETLRSHLIQEGYKQAEKFSWTQSAQQLVDLYTQVNQSR
jgi:glycosyltransferase involved in cell wall biosynthesis